jgi:hypothetical protein
MFFDLGYIISLLWNSLFSICKLGEGWLGASGVSPVLLLLLLCVLVTNALHTHNLMLTLKINLPHPSWYPWHFQQRRMVTLESESHYLIV